MNSVVRSSFRGLNRFHFVRNFSENAANAAVMTLNLSTPHENIYSEKTVDKVLLPGENGEYGVTVGHSPIISQLKPGVVSVIHTEGTEEKFFVPGGFALTSAESVTDVSAPEIVSLDDLDEGAIKAGLADAQKALSSAADGSIEKATAQTEIAVYSAMARSIGVAV